MATKEPKTRNFQASDLLSIPSDHPLHASFFAFSKGNRSKRQARSFLQRYPQYREVKVEVK